MYRLAMAKLAPITRRALRDVPLVPADESARALAVHYAAMIDTSAIDGPMADAIRFVAGAVQLAEDPLIDTAWRKIERALAAHSVASDFGPKYLAALESLGMTPRARRALVREANGAPDSPLDQLRERRRQRATE
jgi:hypothetical protein